MIVTLESLEFQSPGGFVVVEGVNGAGKSTLMRGLSEYLASLGIANVSTFEPGDHPLGKTFRNLLLDHSEHKLTPFSELCLFAADRREHVERVIRPALKNGSFVVCDRYYYSTEAFQGYGRNLNLETVKYMNAAAIDGLFPDLVILLNLDPIVGIARNAKRSTAIGPDDFEKEEAEFHERLHAGFLTIAETAREPFLILDATKSPEEVLQQAKSALDKVLSSWKRS